ncbi:MAG TPA: DUF3082 domain-containing protein [Cyanobacteria bacterium UBA8803]|nr:DUF3082 domain-containing protein [Cyanobacteria bacterium UBA9273]HBL60037.1 DUF3082 domain-containing protein [Cyanobacteria bacterium UBA8803]
MNTPTPTPNSETQLANPEQTLPGPLRCLSAALISALLAVGSYYLTSSIAQTFANKPLPSGNVATINIAIAVRTLVVGITTLATFVFGMVAIGLVALAIQVSIQRLNNRRTPPSPN